MKKYNAVVLKGGVVDAEGDVFELSGCVFDHKIPVYWNFDRSTIVGEAELTHETSQDAIVAEITIDEYSDSPTPGRDIFTPIHRMIEVGDILFAGVGGRMDENEILETDPPQRKITKFTLTCIGLIPLPVSKDVTPLKPMQQ